MATEVVNYLATTLNTAPSKVQHTDSDFFPNIEVLLKIMATLTCECERSISTLTLIKSPLRSSMRLNGLAMLYHHQDVQLTPEDVDEFANRTHDFELIPCIYL